MLVLSRKEGETLMIGDDIKVSIQRIRGNVVSVGIEAPQQVKVLRGELVGVPHKLPPPESGKIGEGN